MATVTKDMKGVANGVAATAANMGSTPNNPSPGTGGQIVGIADSVVGATGVQFVNGTTQVCVVTYDLTSDVNQRISFSFKMPAAAPPTTNNRLIAIFTAGTARGYIVLKPDGKLYMGGQGGSGEAVMASGTVMTAYYNTFVRVEIDWYGGTITTDGSMVGRFYADPFTGTQVGAAFSNAAMNTGSGVITTPQVQIGVTTVEATAGQGITADYLMFANGAVANPGAAPSASAPTTTASAWQYPLAGDTVSISSTEAGTFSSATWSATEIPAGASNPTFANPASAATTVSGIVAGKYIIRRRLVWTGGNVDSTLILWVHPAAGQDIAVYGGTGATPWFVDGAAPTRTAALNDASTATGIASPDSPANEEQKFIMCPMGVGPVSGFKEYYARTAALSGDTVTLYKEDGTTVVDSWTAVPNNVGIGNIREDQLDVDAGSLAAITGVNDAATLILRRALVVGFKALA